MLREPFNLFYRLSLEAVTGTHSLADRVNLVPPVKLEPATDAIPIPSPYSYRSRSISRGVQYELNEREHKLPPEKRYIQTVVYEGDVKCVVTMLPRLAKHIHSVRFLGIDYTFQRVFGKTNEWEISSFLDNINLREH